MLKFKTLNFEISPAQYRGKTVSFDIAGWKTAGRHHSHSISSCLNLLQRMTVIPGRDQLYTVNTAIQLGSEVPHTLHDTKTTSTLSSAT